MTRRRHARPAALITILAVTTLAMLLFGPGPITATACADPVHFHVECGDFVNAYSDDEEPHVRITITDSGDCDLRVELFKRDRHGNLVVDEFLVTPGRPKIKGGKVKGVFIRCLHAKPDTKGNCNFTVNVENVP
jgi:hypothetical protein